MKIKSLHGISQEEILATLNESFSDYLVPLQLNLQQLAAKIKSEKVNLDYSVGAFDDNKLVGFILHGYDIANGKKLIYNAATGVIPSQRGQGLTRKMYDFIIPILKEQNVDSMVLEVITKNVQAIKTYETVGFRAIRKLECYRGEIHPPSFTDVSIRPIHEFDWNMIRTYWDFLPSWQNTEMAIENGKENFLAYGAFNNYDLVGYIIINPLNKRVHQFGVDKQFRRRKIGSALFAHVIEPGSSVSIINVEDTARETNEFLNKIGLTVYVEQYEMKMVLDENN